MRNGEGVCAGLDAAIMGKARVTVDAAVTEPGAP
jgi:hypothetical protein